MNTEDMVQEAHRILQLNDKGHYTVPTHGLYPFQWNWDSCLTALGQQQLSDDRAWLEIETLVQHQWTDGMVPHIVFHEPNEGYFPGPEVWGTDRQVPTSGITQPPVMGLVLEQLWQRSPQADSTQRRCLALMHAADRWHQWFYRCRDPHGTGLVALLHPWESGRDNSLDWVDALADVPADHVGPYLRRDTQHVDPSHRPTQFEYDRYVALVQGFRALGWDNSRLHDASPFQVVDPGFNAILIHSDQALARLAQALDDPALARRAQARAQQGISAMDKLWSDTHGQYLCLNRRTGALVDSASVGGLLPVLVLPTGHAHLRALCERIQTSLQIAPFGVASHWPNDPRFDGKRYWRGPSWLIVNYLLIKGLRDSGEHDLAHGIVAASLRCIEHAGCSEYYHPVTGEALGGGTFTWTAAMVLEFLQFHQPA